MNLDFAHPWALLLAFLAILPWRGRPQPARGYSSLAMLPDDPLSAWLDRFLRGCGVLAVAGLTAALAGPFEREQWVERVGSGAHIVLLIDHSSSMNENFAGRYLGGAARESKAAVASRLLAEFIGRRPADLFGLVAFSAAAIHVLPLGADHEAVQTAVHSLGNRGHGITHIAPGLAMALDYFDGQPVTGSRVILLVSDGAARIEPEVGALLKQQFRDYGASLYWIYLRNPKSGSLTEPPKNPNETTSPEYFLHRYFEDLGVPYRAYQATGRTAVEAAIADLETLENKPIRYREKLPRRDRSDWGYGLALACLAILLLAQRLEVSPWQR
jgi:mxaC protein